MANINCHIDCQKNVVVCDTIAVDEKKRFSKTLELPLIKLDSKDRDYVLNTLMDTELYVADRTNKGAIISEGEANCFAAPTVALLFRDGDSTVVGQLLIDFKCYHYNLYYFIDRKFLIVEDENHDIDIPFYSKANAALLRTTKKYRLSCVPD